MKFSVHKGLSREKLLRVLPPAFAALVPKSYPEPVTAIYFPDKVVTARVAGKALARVAPDSATHLVLVAYDFTEEAQEAAAAVGANILRAASDAVLWTDQSLVAVRTFVATHRPPPFLQKPNEPV